MEASRMRILLGFIGFIMIATTILDIIWTTLGRGGGPITTRISSWLWKAALFYHQFFPSRRFLSIVGVFIILIIIALWMYLIWIGWTLIFCIDEGAVISTKGGKPADIIGRFYFAGY